MKKKIFVITIIVLLVLVCTFGRGISYYWQYAIPDKNYFGDQYKELLYPMSFSNIKQATEIMGEVDDAFSFIGNKENAESKFGELSRYCITEKDAVTENHKLKLVTANFENDKGYLWFVYSNKALDKNNKIISASGGILVRSVVEKTNQGWKIIDTKEHP